MEKYLERMTSRRDLLRAGGVAAFAAFIGKLIGAAKPARAQPLSGSVPEVGRVAVRVVTDSFYSPFSPGTKLQGLQVERFAGDERDATRSSLVSEFGLSLHLESQRGGETRNFLLDFGYTADAINKNLDQLHISPAALDAMVLSHGHYDHFGGLVGFLAKHRASLKSGIPFYVGGEECFCSRETGSGDRFRNFGVLDRKAISEAKVNVLYAERPTVIGGHAFTTGRIGQASFERVLAGTRMTVGVTDGVGCFPDQLPEDRRNVKTIPDDFDHEQATCFNVSGRGLVVITSCGHRGIVNSVRRAMQVAGVQKVAAIVGGFHLAPQREEYVHDTVLALKEINPDYIIPMHCTGDVFIDMVRQEMPGKFVRSYTGSRYIVSA